MGKTNLLRSGNENKRQSVKTYCKEAAKELPISRLRGRKNSLLTGKKRVASLIPGPFVWIHIYIDNWATHLLVA